MLQKQTVSLNLGNGMDQKTDDKIGPDNNFSQMADFIYKKIGKLYKRFGTERLPNTVTSSLVNPPVIGSSNIPSAVTTFKDQLLIENNGYFYSYYENNLEWALKGHHYPLEIETQTSISGDFTYYEATSVYFNNFRIIAYRVSVGVNSELRYAVIEQSTGNYLINDALVQGSAFYPKFIKFSDKVFLAYDFFDTIYVREVNLTTGQLGSALTVATGLFGEGTIYEYDLQTFPFNVVVTNKTGVGERALIVYYSNANTMKVIALKSDGTVDSAMGTYTVALALSRGFAIEYEPNSDCLFIGYQIGYNVAYHALRFTASSISLLTSATVYTATTYTKTQVMNFEMVRSTNSNNIYFFFDLYNLNLYYSGGIGTPAVEGVIYKSVINYPTGVIETAVPFYHGFQLSSKFFRDTTRGTIYGFIQNTGGDQKTNFAIDLCESTGESPVVLAKWNYSVCYNLAYYNLPILDVIDDSLYFVSLKVIDKVGNPSDAYISTVTPTLADKLGIAENFINILPTQSLSKDFLSNTRFMSGGYLGCYDGSSVFEQGFFLDPELIDVCVYPKGTGKRITITIIQQGTASVPEITSVAFPNGGAMLSASFGAYWTFYSTATQLVSVSYALDGATPAPAGSGVTVLVNINSYDTAYEIARKTRVALQAVGLPITVGLSGNTITIQNNANVSVPDASDTNFRVPVSATGLNAGTYQFMFVWKYYDNNGQVIYSAPSLPKTITAALGDIASLVCYVPNITNKNNDYTIAVEVYRTQANGTVFYKTNAETEVLYWAPGNYGVVYVDIKSDAALMSSPEFIYTNGGILPNYQIPAVKHISTFKNRLMASGVDDPTIVYYSKIAINGVPVEFTQEGYIQVDLDSDPITGHIQLDDKFIIWKKKKIYYVAGDGANDLGQGSTFTLPTLIAADVGCISKNSIVITPLGAMFKSEKGIYLLDRALSVSYIGKEVEDYNSEDVMSAVLLAEDNQVRFVLKNEITLVYDYLFNRWTTFSQYNGDSAYIWKNKFTRIDGSGLVYFEDKNLFVDLNSDEESYSPYLATKWLQIKNVQDYQRVYRLAILGDLKSPHTLNYKIYYDYDETNFDEYNFDSSLIDGSEYDDTVYQPIIHLKRQKCDALKVVMTVIPNGDSEESLQLVDMSMQVGVKQGLQKVKADKKL